MRSRFNPQDPIEKKEIYFSKGVQMAKKYMKSCFNTTTHKRNARSQCDTTPILSCGHYQKQHHYSPENNM